MSGSWIMINHKRKLAYSCSILLLFSTSSMSAEANFSEVSTNNVKGDSSKAPNKNINSNTAPLVIQSQVKGSQEQPKVIYIMPWQGVDKVIAVKGKQRTIKLPHFKPINPRDFRNQVRLFVNKSPSTNAETSK